MEYNNNNPLKVIELFAGYGSQRLALQRLKDMHSEFDFKVTHISEIDKHALKAYELIHGDCPNLGDVCKIDWSKVEPCDLVTWSFPCGLKGTLIDTDKGYKDISEVEVGDMVLTHNNRYMRVTETMHRTAPGYFTIKGTGFLLKLTANHPMYVMREGVREWIAVKDLRAGDFLAINIPNKSREIKLSDDYLWLLGRYLASGDIVNDKECTVTFNVDPDDERDFVDTIPAELLGKSSKEKKNNRWVYRVPDAELQKLCREFGIITYERAVPSWCFEMTPKQTEQILQGYLSANGRMRYCTGEGLSPTITASYSKCRGIQSATDHGCPFIMEKYTIVYETDNETEIRQ